MFIRKKTEVLSYSIGNYDNQLKIIIPSQYIEYDVINKDFIEPTICITIKLQYVRESDPIEEKFSWSLLNFSKFVDGFVNEFKNLKEIASPFLKANNDFNAFFKITDSIYVQSIIVSQDISGAFKKSKYEDVQQIRFETSAHSYYWIDKHWLQYDKVDLKPLIELRDDFVDQINKFKKRINDI